MPYRRAETRTKIVCTLGPATSAPETMDALLREGMSAARINYSHGTQSEHAGAISRVRAAAAALDLQVAVVADLQGPKIRLGEFPPVQVAAGGRLTLADLPSVKQVCDVVPLPHPEVLRALRTGDKILFDDGAVEAVVGAVGSGRVEIEILAGGWLSSHKGVAAPQTKLPLDSLTAKDLDDAAHAVACGADYIALSFVRTSADVRALRQVLDAMPGGQRVGIVAKIETRAAIDHLDEILRASEAVMVARGDLGVEISPQEVPLHQKDIIWRANRLGVPVITATQMLQSMVEAPRPTRAEASDVANAILDGTDAVMLSAETAIGRYPREAVATMREIAAIAETRMSSRVGDVRFEGVDRGRPVTDAIGDATVSVAERVGARLIATSTWSGTTARQISRERPRLPIVALTPNDRVARQLAIVWGVVSILVPSYNGTDEMLEVVARALVASGHAAAGDLVVVTAGIPFGGGGKTDFLKVHRL